MQNRLANETSPYLLQHADNPVDWYPWGQEALDRAEAEDKPILLSIGYAACHWCHVMAHESFEDPGTAAFMNQHFINVKVDREERPDLDNIYMNAVVALTGQGGWPMTVALTPAGLPFFGGTYFPPAPRYGMPSFLQVLASLNHAWQEQRQQIGQNAEAIAAHLQASVQFPSKSETITDGLLVRAVAGIANSFDSVQGGFGRAPKFPQAMTIEFLIRQHLRKGDPQALQMAELTLGKMAEGGIYDHIGGGFARYSTDNDWLVPHFEKMLYDNALLARAYLHAWLVTGNPLYRRVVEETLNWVLAEMTHKDGGFYSSLDADSEGEEGKFYVWQAEEIRTALGADADLFMERYGVSDPGNWEGKNILNTRTTFSSLAEKYGLGEGAVEAKLDQARMKLYQLRSQRIWPGLDDKVLTSWNGLMLAAFAEAGRYLDRQEFTQAAVNNAQFLQKVMRRGDGRLLRTWREGGQAKLNAYLEDYAYLADGLLALYQTTFDERWYRWAGELVEFILRHFRDENQGGYFDTSSDHEQLIQRPKDLQDNAVPSGNAAASCVLLLLSLYSGEGRYWDQAMETIGQMYGPMARHPTAFAQWLVGATFALSEPKEVAVIGDARQAGWDELMRPLLDVYRPDLVIAAGKGSPDEGVPLLAGRSQIDGLPTAYVCRRFACRQPVTDPDALKALLTAMPAPNH